MTIAEQIAEYCGNDGMRLSWDIDELRARGAQVDADRIDYDGRVWLCDLCASYRATVQRRRGTELVSYTFADGSAIAECGDAWDVRPDGCTQYCWAGVGCSCDK
jgi:hypothetical protein